MRVLVCGDRKWRDGLAIARELRKLQPPVTVIEGEARGADTLARLVADKLGMTVERYPAEWGKYGKAAGPIRNKRMLEEGCPDLVLAFHTNIRASRGTADMVRRAEKVGIPVKVITEVDNAVPNQS